MLAEKYTAVLYYKNCLYQVLGTYYEIIGFKLIQLKFKVLIVLNFE